MIEVVDALRELLEPTDPDDSTVSENDLLVDKTASAPFDFEPSAFYAWEESSSVNSIGTGEYREDYEIICVVTEPNIDEAAGGKRLREVSEALDVRREVYLRAIRNAPSRDDLWGELTAVTDADFLRQLGVRGLAVRVSGWRIVTPT